MGEKMKGIEEVEVKHKVWRAFYRGYDIEIEQIGDWLIASVQERGIMNAPLEQYVLGVNAEGKVYFGSEHGESFDWIGELKIPQDIEEESSSNAEHYVELLLKHIKADIDEWIKADEETYGEA